jgi:hypothetical protein
MPPAKQDDTFDGACAEFWAALGSERAASAPTARRLLSRIEPRLGWEPAERGPWGVLTYAELEARGVAERLAEIAPRSLMISVGRPPMPWLDVCRSVMEQTGVDISAARVRAGFTRGHLLEVVVGISPSSGDVGLAAELAVEGLLGEAFVDDWIVAVDAAPLPRTGPLRVVQKAAPAESMHPLSELCAIAERAVCAVDEQLPTVPRATRRVGAEWTVLDMEPSDVGPAPDRVLITTYEPELVKCALEGMPFHSRRFSRVGERFAWLGAPALEEGAADRQQRLQHIEEELDLALRARELGAVIGSGFGKERDYFDLCLAAPASAGVFADVTRDPALAAVVKLAQHLGFGGAGAMLGFYDTRWSEVRIEL